ncbi:MAG: hypothetical protein KDJ50_03225 [Alphaproteobacteria bacterium]|nr:hypothetical protein [Alphaproteobacteria bacterium]
MAKVETDPKVFYVKAKVYRFTSLLFVTIGIFVFCVLYVKNIDGRLMEALREPYTIFYFLVPFVPGAVLTIMADRAEKKYRALLEKK